ncbi:MAG: hypothetical protein WDA65_03675 [Christensenellales bacterium]
MDFNKADASDGLDLAYQYNRAGQLTQISYKTSATGEQHNLGYVYDDFGRASQIRFDGNIVREYEYDTYTGTLLNMKDYRGFDENDIDDYIKTAYTYNSAGLVTQITYSDAEFVGDDNPSGITEQYTVQYDGRGYIVGERLDTDYSKTEAATSIYKAYEYDAIGRLLKSASGETQQEAWNNWDRLTQYTYDRVGNRLTMDNGDDVLGYTYNQFNQLQGINKNSDIQTTYEYDLRGNQTKESSKYFDGRSNVPDLRNFQHIQRAGAEGAENRGRGYNQILLQRNGFVLYHQWLGHAYHRKYT